MEYRFSEIEKKWQQQWIDTHAYRVSNTSEKPKFYVLDMFPYPSGAGLHVGHPLGYIASDIYSRFKRLKGYNVLHPMGYDAFGLPAEQYAIEHGVHPAVSTAQNIANFRRQLDNIGFCYDWEREVRTCEPGYYKWTQWIFLQLFNSFYNRSTNKAEPISNLIAAFEQNGNAAHPMPNAQHAHSVFTAGAWKAFDTATQQDILMQYRLAYCGYGEVNWCEALGTVLANDEVVNGVSERGGHPVVKKKLRQWYLRITEYADRLLEGLNRIEFSEAMKEMQTNWIGKSSGAEIDFKVRLTPNPSPRGEGGEDPDDNLSGNYFQTADTFYWSFLKEFSRQNRKQQTEAEDLLWQHIRNNQLGVKVRRQHAIQGYIVDFALLKAGLAIEVDGAYHNEEEQRRFDEARTRCLAEYGIDVLRFTNEEVLTDIAAVLESIRKELQSRTVQPETDDHFPLLRAEKGAGDEATLRVYTTRPDTIFGVDFMVIAPEHELVDQIKSPEQTAAVDEYVAYVKSRSERERMAEKKISGVFTGAYAINPFDGREIPIWISEYVLAGYGTGAIMAVPCGDERDHKFARHFDIPITNIIGAHYNGEEANPTKDAVLENSGFLNGMPMRQAMEVVINKLEELEIGTRKVNYKMRDAAFSRQRYWGEPFPIRWSNGTAVALPENELPLLLPEVESYAPGPEGEGPLANIPAWVERELETNTMPGYAGSSWYFLRYMDPQNAQEFCSRSASDYWGQVDLYIGGTEHAVGHLLYSRMWTKALYDLGHIGFDEPFKKLVNQGMIQGSSRFVYRLKIELESNADYTFPHQPQIFISKGLYDKLLVGDIDTNDALRNELPNIFELIFWPHSVNFSLAEIKDIEATPIHVDVNLVDGHELDIDKFRKWRPEYRNAAFIDDNYNISTPILERGVEVKLNVNVVKDSFGRYITGSEVEKMSKSKFNTVNPDDLVQKYGADTFRMYEMFLGPVEISKPWDTKGIEGVHRFLKKLWRLFFDEEKGARWNNDTPTPAELKVLHKTIKKIEEDTERFSFNTGVSTFMICVNELTDLKCHKKEVLQPLLVLLTPYAPHIAEELWQALGNSSSVLDAAFPIYDEAHLRESDKAYPVAINGKTRSELTLSLDATQQQVEAAVLADATVQKWLEGKTPKKIIYVKNKMINVVV